ncbi:MAG: hypothetical protein QOD75_2062 [Blastocatellia bacterium]|jgi:hypothetical protein|nr:hypothetical protein [Blastocatellia bacterium]
MPARKKTPQTRKASSSKVGKASSAAARGGAVPPYGVPIREAIARGDMREMRMLAASTRKWFSEVSFALAKLESSLKKSGA